MLALTIWSQQADWGDLGIVALLVVLEGVLSIDNALVLGLLAKRLPAHQRRKALTYGLVGAFAFRFIAIALAAWLTKWYIVKLFGGGYLVYIAIKHLLFEAHEESHDERVAVDTEGEPTLIHGGSGEPLTAAEESEELRQRVPLPLHGVTADMPADTGPIRKYPSFWWTVFAIEMTDIAFAVDSILAAIGVVGSRQEKLWVIILGGILGVILMRFAAVVFIRLLERFPRFEMAAYLLVAVIGVKLLVDWGFNTEAHPHTVDFHNYRHIEFWVFWVTMLLSFLTGFLPKKRPTTPTT